MSVRRVIVGVDRQESAEAALDWAVTETAAVGSVLVLGRAGDDRTLDWAVAVARRRLDPGRIQPVRRAGAAGGVLVDLAYAEDILVLGAPARRHGIGSRSTTYHVLGNASCPVVVVPSPSSVARRRESLSGRDRPGLACPDHVVVGVGPSEAAPAALAFGFAYAARHRLPLAAVRVTGAAGREVWSDDQVPNAAPAPEPAAAGRLAEQLTRFEREYPRVAVRRLVVAGEVAPGLVAASDGAALLVAGAAEGGPGPVVRGLVDLSLCPVAVVRRQ